MTVSSLATGEDSAPPLPHPQEKWKLELIYGRKQIAFGQDGTLYIATSGNDSVLTAMEPNRKIRWSWVSHRGGVMSQPQFDEERNILVTVGDRLVKIAPNGGMWWQRKFYSGGDITLGAGRPASFTVAPDGTIYLAAGYLEAYSPAGERLWQFRGTQPLRAVRINGSVVEAADGKKRYVVSRDGKKISEEDDSSGSVFAASSGTTEFRLGSLRMGSDSGNRSFNQVIALTHGKQLWEFAPGIELQNVVPYGSSVLVGGSVVAALNAADGNIKWRINTKNSISVQVLGNSVIAGCDKGATVCAYDANGKLRWAFVGSAKEWYAPAATVSIAPDHTIYVADDQKSLTAIKDVAMR